jgi:uncharacterized repeat protein (TIGR01451 family)
VNLRGGFIIPAPANAAYRTARLLRGGVVLTTRTASPHAPIITSLAPDGGEIVNDQPVTISWKAQDADGDALTYDVQFSDDGGQTWTGLDADLDANQLVVPRHTLPGSTRALIRVIASDGFNTAVRTSTGVFKLSDLPPRLRLVSPTPGQQFRPQQMVSLRAEIDDPQDGPLSGTNIVWQSNRNGAMGTGSFLSRQASTLLSGLHQLTVTSRNSAGKTNSATVSITIGTSAPTSFADVSLTTTFSPPVAYVSSNLTQVCTVRNAGPELAVDVRLTNTVPSGLKLVSAEASQGNWSRSGDSIIAVLGDLDTGEEASLTTTFTGVTAGMFTNRVVVAGSTPDPVPANNETTRVLTINNPDQPRPDLVVSFSEVPTGLGVGGTGDFVIQVFNAGSVGATGVMLTNSLPTGLSLLSATASAGGKVNMAPARVVAEFGSVPAGETVWLRTQVHLDSSDPLLVQAAAFGIETDTEPQNNEATSILSAAVESSVRVSRGPTGVEMTWPETPKVAVEQTDQLGPAAQWVPASGTPVLDQGRWRLVVQPTVRTRFYRFRPL